MPQPTPRVRGSAGATESNKLRTTETPGSAGNKDGIVKGRAGRAMSAEPRRDGDQPRGLWTNSGKERTTLIKRGSTSVGIQRRSGPDRGERVKKEGDRNVGTRFKSPGQTPHARG